MQRLKDVMSRDVKLVTPDTTIREAAQQMRDGDFGMLPVAENDRMIGAISGRDIAVPAIADGHRTCRRGALGHLAAVKREAADRSGLRSGRKALLSYRRLNRAALLQNSTHDASRRQQRPSFDAYRRA